MGRKKENIMTGVHVRENPPYWPGGIPAHVRCHAQPIPWQQLDNEIQGWLLFLDVSRVQEDYYKICREKAHAHSHIDPP